MSLDGNIFLGFLLSQLSEVASNLHLCVSNGCFLASDIEDLPPAVQEKLFDEVLDRDVQKGTDQILLST